MKIRDVDRGRVIKQAHAHKSNPNTRERCVSFTRIRIPVHSVRIPRVKWLFSIMWTQPAEQI